jgi:tetratricopeptide (TPR) repeat protein
MASSVLTLLAQRQGKAVAPFEALPLRVRLENVVQVYVTYLGQLLWPARLAAYYPHPGLTITAARVLGSGLLLLGITALVLGPGRRWPYLAVGWLWYLGTLVPVIGLVQVGGQALGDRYTYVPLIGLFLALTWGLSDLAAAWHLPRLVLVGITAGFLCVCAAFTWTQLGYWRGDQLLWEHAIEVTDNNARAHSNLGTVLRSRGRTGEALAQFRAAADLSPESANIQGNLASVLQELGRWEKAEAAYHTVLRHPEG